MKYTKTLNKRDYWTFFVIIIYKWHSYCAQYYNFLQNLVYTVKIAHIISNITVSDIGRAW